MMVEQFLASLQTKGVKIWLDGDKLGCRAPKGVMTAAIQQELKERKTEILAFLKEAQAATKSTSIPLKPVVRDGELPLSFAQQRMWFLYQLDKESPFYNESLQVRIVGKLSVTALEVSINEIIRRHEALRTTFAVREGIPVQVIAADCTINIPVVDLQDLPQAAVQEIVTQEVRKPFDLSIAPLLRATLIRQQAESHLLILTMHHIITDGWSMGIFFQELELLYSAFTGGQTNPLPELTIQYADFAIWQRQWLTKEVQQQQLDYWKQQLAGAPPLLELPTDYPRPAVQTFSGANQRFRLEKDLTTRLVTLSQKSGVTLFMTLLTAFAILLHRYSGQDDICIGSPFANRDRQEVTTLIGFFVNTLVLRTQIAENPSFSQLLEQVRTVVFDAHANQDLPFEQVVEALQPERSLGYNPLFQVMFVLENFSLDTIELPDISLTPEMVERGTSGFDLSLSIWETKQGLIGSWEYNSDLFAVETIDRMTLHFQTLLETIVSDPHQRVGELALLTESQRHQLLVEWNDTQVEYPQNKCIHQLFEEQVARTPDVVAVVFENEQLTYHELNCRANGLANYLQTLGVQPDTLVGICVERSLEMVVGLLGILKAGGAYVPLDPDYPQERLSFMLEDADVGVLLTQRKLREKLPQHQAEIVVLDDVLLTFDSNQDNPITNVQHSNLAYVIYTSGSTGKPKGAMNTHLGICNRLLWMQQAYQLTAGDRILQKTPFSFDVSVWEFFWPLLTGARLVVAQPGGHKDSAYLVNLIQQQQVTTVHFVPSMLQIFLEADSVKNCHSLKRVICSGEALPKELQERFFAVLNCELHNLYGPTEAAIDVTYWQCQPESSLRTVPIGRPIANTQIYILDSYLQPVPIGVPGELHIGGVGLARGYLNRSELTQEKFISNPFDKSKLYKTGDLARYLPDGNIEYIRRIDNQVKIRGFRIELGEIEAVLSQYPHVQANCVIVREDHLGDKRLIAYLVTHRDCQTNISELRQYLKARLPEYMIPTAFVMLESLPLTPNGKVDRRALPAPDLYSSSTDKYLAPRTPIEELLAQMWAQVLKVESVGIHDNFFELGGHSLLATQVVSRIRTLFKVELPLRELFSNATVAQLAQEIKQLQQQAIELTASAISPRTSDAQLPLSYAQQRLWFLDKLNPNSALYNIPIALRLVGKLNQAALEQSLMEIIHRHEALRTNFITVDGQATQVIRGLLTLDWGLGIVSVVDLRDLSTSEQESALQQLAQQQATQPFDLAKGALVRTTLVMLSETEQALLVCIHHIVFDGWSMTVFVEELAALYNAYTQGQLSPLAPMPIQYADFAIWQREWLQGDVLQSQLAYWQKQLANAPALLALPTDRPRPAVQTFAGAHQEFALSAQLTDKLLKLSQEQGVTLFMTLLAAYNTLLYRYTGQEDILVGSPIANRDRSEIEGLIGFFVNTLVMRANLAGNPSFSELLGHVREVSLGAYSHQHLPFEMLVEALQPERNLSHTPLFQVMFSLENTPTSGVELHGLTVTPLITESVTAKFDLTLAMQNTPTGLVGVWEYNTDLFDDSTIKRMAGHFVTLLEGIVANPEQRVSQLPLLTQTEQQKLLVEWNDTQADYPLDQCIHQLFEEQVQLTPDAVAVVDENQQLTYQELNCRANQLAQYLKSLGVGADVLVGICVERSIEMVVGLLGILKASGAYLPIDPDYPSERLQFMLEDAQVKVLLTQQRLVDRLAEQKAHLVCLDTDAGVISQFSQENLIPETQATNLAYVIYTSGSTGTPKGVMVAHKGLLNLVFWHQRAFNVTALDRATQLAGTAFDAAVWELWPYLTAGASIYLVKSQLLSSLGKLRDWLISQKITISFLPTPLAQELFTLAWPAESLALRTILTGGDKLQQYPSDSLPFQVVNNYGPTENTVVATSGLVVAKGQEQLSPNIGKAIANTQVYILDKNLQPVPVGVPGELHIAGVGLAKGYLNRPELTQERFIPNPFGIGCLYKTGDLARYLPDGNIEYLERIDNQVKIRGFRIELAEIETLLGQHSDVQQCCVIAREATGGNKRLFAYVVTRKDVTPTTAELRQFLTDKLPGYMVPSAFVILESLPLTPNGKVDRRALPNPDLHQELSNYVMPNTEAEKIIAGIWQKALQVEKVGIYDNFFEIGGNSLLLVKINQQLQGELGLELSIVDMFNYPNIYSLSQYLTTRKPKENPLKDNISRTQSRSEINALKSQRLQSRKQHRSQQKGRKEQ